MKELHINIELITAEIKKRKMSKTKFAHECGIAKHTLDKILSDNTKMTFWPFLKIAAYLGIKMNDLHYFK